MAILLETCDRQWLGASRSCTSVATESRMLPRYEQGSQRFLRLDVRRKEPLGDPLR